MLASYLQSLTAAFVIALAFAGLVVADKCSHSTDVGRSFTTTRSELYGSFPARMCAAGVCARVTGTFDVEKGTVYINYGVVNSNNKRCYAEFFRSYGTGIYGISPPAFLNGKSSCTDDGFVYKTAERGDGVSMYVTCAN